MGGCWSAASTPVLRQRLHRAVSIPCISLWLHCDNALKGTKARALARWVGRVRAHRHLRGKHTETLAIALRQVVVLLSFRRLKRPLRREKCRQILTKWAAKLATGAVFQRFQTWKTQLFRAKQALLRLESRTFPVIRHLSKSTKSLFRSALLQWQQQALQAASIPTQIRTFSLFRLEKALKTPIWRLFKQNIPSNSANTDTFFSAIVTLGTNIAQIHRKHCFSVWNKASSLIKQKEFRAKTGKIVEIAGVVRFIRKKVMENAVKRWKVWKEWRQVMNLTAELTGKRYFVADIRNNFERKYIKNVKKWELYDKMRVFPCYLSQIDLVSHQTVLSSNRKVLQKANKVLGNAEIRHKFGVFRCFTVWKESLTLHYLQITRKNRAISQLSLLFRSLKARKLLISLHFIRLSSSNSHKNPIYRLLTRKMHPFLQLSFQNIRLFSRNLTYFPQNRQATDFQASFLRLIHSKFPWKPLKKVVFLSKIVPKLSKVCNWGLSLWLYRWKVNVQGPLVGNKLQVRRKQLLCALIRRRMAHNAVWYFRTFVKKLKFAKLMGNLMPKMTIMKEKRLLKLGFRMYFYRLKKEKQVKVAFLRIFRDKLNLRLKELLSDWMEFADTERSKVQVERTYLGAAMGAIGGRFRALFSRK